MTYFAVPAEIKQARRLTTLSARVVFWKSLELTSFSIQRVAKGCVLRVTRERRHSKPGAGDVLAKQRSQQMTLVITAPTSPLCVACLVLVSRTMWQCTHRKAILRLIGMLKCD